MLLQISNPTRADMFNVIFQNIKLFTDNINITFTAEQIDIQCIDPGHVAILEVHIGSDWFDKYELSDNIESLVIGANATALNSGTIKDTGEGTVATITNSAGIGTAAGSITVVA